MSRLDYVSLSEKQHVVTTEIWATTEKPNLADIKTCNKLIKHLKSDLLLLFLDQLYEVFYDLLVKVLTQKRKKLQHTITKAKTS